MNKSKDSEEKKYWFVHGKAYDFTPFIKRHPGGSQILERARLMEDCGALFETYHAFSNKTAIRQSMEKYRVEGVQKNEKIPIYDFIEYNELIERIKNDYPDRSFIKANLFYFIKNTIFFLLYIMTFYFTFFLK